MYQNINLFLFPIAFIIIPHILRSLFTLLTQKWPEFSLRNIKKCPNNFKTIKNFEWLSIFEALPVVHLVKRLFNFYNLVRYPERFQKISTLCCWKLILWHDFSPISSDFNFTLGPFYYQNLVQLKHYWWNLGI